VLAKLLAELRIRADGDQGHAADRDGRRGVYRIVQP
jgi:hypothetical protein